MGSGKVLAFLPCRAGSVRVPHKNTRPFAGLPGGLLSIKLRQLAAVHDLDEVVVDSNDPTALELAEAQRAWWPKDKQLSVRSRPDHLGQSSTTTDALIRYALDTLDGCELLWTHATSPMVDASVYDRAIAAYRTTGNHDSLMSVHPVRGFLWSEDGPINYDRNALRWPRTQDLRPLYEVDSAIFLVPFAVARQHADRVGSRPMLFELSAMETIDVDWEEDFLLAEHVYRAGHGNA